MARRPRLLSLVGVALLVPGVRALADPPEAGVADVGRGGERPDAPGLDARADATADGVDAADAAADAATQDAPPADARPAPATPAVVPAFDRTDVVHYALDATLDAARHEVAGEGTLRWRNTSRVEVRDLWFHLYLNGFRDDHTLFMRSTGGAHRGNAVGARGRVDVRTLRLATGEDLLAGATNDPAVPDDATQLHVTLPRPVRPGETLTIAMAWTAKLPEVFARTGYSGRFHMVGQWFPKVAVLEEDGRWAHFPFHGNSEFYSDFGTYDVALTVPRGWTVGATGERAELARTDRGDRHRYRAARVHDFAWTAWDGFRERTATAGDGVRLRVLYPRGQEAAAARNIATLQAAMPVFVRRFGYYAWPNLTVVLPPRGAEGAAGMEYPTLITTGGAWWHPDGVRLTEVVTVHEFAHQYFQGLLASNENAWPFLDEGLAEYATGVVLEELHPPGGALVEALGVRLAAFAWEGASSAGIRYPQPVASGAAAFPTFGSYGSHVYARTATILRTAELTWGRAAVAAALRRYADRMRFHHPTPDDLLDAFRATAGRDVVERLLRPALFGDASVDYAVQLVESHRARATPGGARWRGHVVVHRRGALELPVSIALEREDGQRVWHFWDGRGAVHEVPYAGPSPLRAAYVDPRGRVPLDANRLDNARLAPGHEAEGLPVVARLAYWFGLALQAVGP